MAEPKISPKHTVIYSILKQIDYLILMKRWMLKCAKLKVNIRRDGTRRHTQTQSNIFTYSHAYMDTHTHTSTDWPTNRLCFASILSGFLAPHQWRRQHVHNSTSSLADSINKSQLKYFSPRCKWNFRVRSFFDNFILNIFAMLKTRFHSVLNNV